MRIPPRLALLFAAVLLPACGGDLIEYQSKPGPGKPVFSPFSITSASDEVFSRDSGAMPLITVDMPNNKNEEPVVHTPWEGLTSTPASQPATAPASQPAASEPAPTPITVSIVSQKNKDDQITLVRDNEANVDLYVICSSGIGTVTLEHTGDTWPALVRVHLRYSQDKPFTRLEGFDAAEISGDRRLALKVASEMDASKAQVTIPAFSRAQRILIQWVDAYR